MCLLTFEDAGRIAGKILLALTFVLVANLVRATGFTEISREISSCGYVRNLQPEIAALVNAQTNSSDKSGLHMKIWNETWTRMKSWNAQVGRYRGDLLPLLSKGLRSYMEGLDPIRKAAFQKDFISDAKLSREEIGCLFGN